jgi:hypothetical protein
MSQQESLPHCPISNAHSRLNEAHQLWHQTAAQYQNPGGFRANLNASIQALRNITFVLQKEKGAVPTFTKWYAGWQTRMREEKILRWLHQARNIVVKEGDLRTVSTARVSLMNWLEFPVAEFEVRPLVPTAQIASDLATYLPQALPQDLDQASILVVERRWVVADLPELELLDVLAHGYGFLWTLIADAHKVCGVEMELYEQTDDLHGNAPAQERFGGKLACMIATKQLRSARVRLDSKEHVAAEMIPRPIDSKNEAKAAKRYGLESSMPAAPKGKDLYEAVKWFMEAAKRVLARDKFHSGVVLLQLPNGGLQLYSLNPADQSGKYVLWERLVDEVERTGAVGLIDIREIWMISGKEFDADGVRPSESPNRCEALAVTVAMADGRQCSYITKFSRGLLGKIKFEPTEEMTSKVDFSIEAVRRAWRRQAQNNRAGQ